jgi:hypothetical protein
MCRDWEFKYKTVGPTPTVEESRDVIFAAWAKMNRDEHEIKRLNDMLLGCYRVYANTAEHAKWHVLSFEEWLWVGNHDSTPMPQPAMDAQRAEIERLTAALATAEAERDAAKRKIRMALAELQSEVDRDTEYDSAYIDEAHAILYNALTPEERAAAPVYDWEPLPAAAPAVDDEPVGDDDDEPYDVTGAVEYARGHVADALVSASNGNYERAFGHLNAALTAAFNSIEALITKGETR